MSAREACNEALRIICLDGSAMVRQNDDETLNQTTYVECELVALLRSSVLRGLYLEPPSLWKSVIGTGMLCSGEAVVRHDSTQAGESL